MEGFGFATGFGVQGRSKPGFSLQNDYFKLVFDGVFCEKRKNLVSHGFECFYDWKPVMEMILEATDRYRSMKEVEKNTEGSLKKWLTTYEGWGLLTSILPVSKALFQ